MKRDKESETFFIIDDFECYSLSYCIVFPFILIKTHAKKKFLYDRNYIKDFDLLQLLTVQENPVSVFFKIRKYVMKFFLICEVFFGFF